MKQIIFIITVFVVAQSAIFAKAAPKPVGQAYPNLQEVIITWKCHLDIGYTHSVPEVIQKYRTIDMDRMLKMFDKTKNMPPEYRFRWMLPAWAMDTVLDNQQTPQRLARLEKEVKEGRLLWHAFPYTFESDAADLEELVRGLSYGSRLARRFGMPLPADAKQTDMPEQAWVLPTVLAHAGVKFLHIGANSGSKPMSEMNKIPILSWWEGPDGSRVLLGYSPEYGWDSIIPPKGWPHKAWLAFFVRGDNQGPPSPQEVENILNQARQKLPGVKVRFGRPSDFADVIIAEEKEHATLPVIRADMPDTWAQGQMSTPTSTAAHRRAAPMLATLGQLDTSLRAWGMTTDSIVPLLDDGYKNGGFYAEHTWGVNGGSYQGRPFRSTIFKPDWRAKYDAGYYKIFDETYEYHMNYGRRALADAQKGLQPLLLGLALAVKCEGPRVVAFNPLPWERDEVINVQLPKETGLAQVVDLETGKETPFEQAGTELRFQAKAIPAGGYKTFALRGTGRTFHGPMPELSPNNILKTTYFSVQLDLERGGISSLIENATGRELVAQGGHVLGQFLHERFSRDNVQHFMNVYTRNWARNMNGDFGKGDMPGADKSPYAAMTPKRWKAEFKSTPVAEEVSLTPSDTLGLARGYELVFTFPKNQAYLDISWHVNEKTPNPIPEGGWLCLPFNVKSPAFRVGRVGGTIDPAKDISFGGNRSLITVDRGITVRQGETGAGVGAASSDLPLWSMGQPGLWEYAPAYVPTQPELFVNLYNNMWTTNYPLWTSGSWQASVRIWPVNDGASEEQADFTPSWELRQGIVTAYADGKAGNLPVSHAGIALSRKGIRVTAFCPNPDGAGTVLRLWDQSGVSGDVTVTIPGNFKTATPVTLRGESLGEPLALKNGQLSLSLKAYAPASFILE